MKPRTVRFPAWVWVIGLGWFTVVAAIWIGGAAIVWHFVAKFW